VKTGPRRQQILHLLEENGSLDVGDLADRFAVTVVTIRKDLDELEREGLLQRTFGGAVFTHRSRFNRSFLERVRQHQREKRAIAAAALEYIKDGDTIILDAGSTTLVLAQLLKQQTRSAFIITCSVPVAIELSSAGYDILLLGGMVRNKSLALLGRETLAMLDRYRADKAFLGSSGFTVEKGHTTPNPDDAQIKEAIMKVSKEIYVLVDSSKYGDQCLTRFAHLRDVDLTITDSHLPKSKIKAIEAAGGTIRVVDVGKADRGGDGNDPQPVVSSNRTLNLHRTRER
jgi:DeoR/GlpR family transcriptional regulator of sugar metabolism